MGKIYPYPTTEKISRKKTDKAYRAVYLENEYLKIMILYQGLALEKLGFGKEAKF